MSVRALRTLVMIADVGSFQRAADRLHLTLSAISMQMRQLEAEFDVAIFDRAYRPPRLTGEGAALAAAAREIVNRYDDLPAIARGGTGDDPPLVGDVALGVTGTVSVRILPGFLARLTGEQPQARVVVETGLSELLVAKVAAGQLDAAIVTGTPDAGRRVAVDVVREEKLVVVAPRDCQDVPAHDPVDGPAVARELLSTQPYIRFRPDTGIGKLVERYLERTGIATRVLLTLDGVEAIVECVGAGLGVTVLPEPDAVRYGGDRVVCLEVAAPSLVRQLTLVTRLRAAAQPLRGILYGLLMASEPRATTLVRLAS